MKLERIDLALLILLSCLVFTIPALSAQELLVRKTITVYSDPNTNSDVLTTLEAGDRAPISEKEYGKFRKILVEAGGKKQAGYILESQLDGNRVRDNGETKKKRHDGEEAFHHKTAIGVPFVISYNQQGPWKFTDGLGSSINISETSGIATFYGFSIDLPMEESLALRIALYFRKLAQIGTAKPDGGTDKKIEKNVNFFGASIIAKYYFSANGAFWLGGGAELSKASKVSLVYADTDPVAVSESDYPTYLILKSAIGFDISLFGDFYLTPEVDFIGAINVSPLALGADFLLTASYAF